MKCTKMNEEEKFQEKVNLSFSFILQHCESFHQNFEKKFQEKVSRKSQSVFFIQPFLETFFSKFKIIL